MKHSYPNYIKYVILLVILFMTQAVKVHAQWHSFPSEWTDEANGKHSKTCLDSGCGVTIYSYDPNGEPMFTIELTDGTVLTYPQSLNPKYTWEEGNEKFTYGENGELALPTTQVKGFYTAWSHKMETTQDAGNGSFTK